MMGASNIKAMAENPAFKECKLFEDLLTY